MREKKLIVRIKPHPVYFLCGLFLWTLFAFNTYNSDYLGYEDHFKRIASASFDKIFSVSNFEKGFILIMKLCSLIINDYRFCLMVIATASIVLIYISVREYADSPVLVLLFYFLYPFLLDVVQIRMCLASSIILFSIRFLTKSNKKNLIAYICCISLASTIHILSILAFAFLAVYIQNKRILVRICTITTIVLYVLIFTVPNIINIFPAAKQVYFTSRSGFVKLSFVWLLISIVMSIICHHFSSKIHGERRNLYVAITKVFVVSMMFAPFIVLTNNFYRAYRILFILFYCLIFSHENNLLTNDNKVRIYQMSIKIVLLVFIIVVSLFEYGPDTAYYKDVVIAIFQKNALWGFLWK
jgi:hypothetical protein